MGQIPAKTVLGGTTPGRCGTWSQQRPKRDMVRDNRPRSGKAQWRIIATAKPCSFRQLLPFDWPRWRHTAATALAGRTAAALGNSRVQGAPYLERFGRQSCKDKPCNQQHSDHDPIILGLSR
jgi:hypothetical protein